MPSTLDPGHWIIPAIYRTGASAACQRIGRLISHAQPVPAFCALGIKPRELLAGKNCLFWRCIPESKSEAPDGLVQITRTYLIASPLSLTAEIALHCSIRCKLWMEMGDPNARYSGKQSSSGCVVRRRMGVRLVLMHACRGCPPPPGYIHTALCDPEPPAFPGIPLVL